MRTKLLSSACRTWRTPRPAAAPGHVLRHSRTPAGSRRVRARSRTCSDPPCTEPSAARPGRSLAPRVGSPALSAPDAAKTRRPGRH